MANTILYEYPLTERVRLLLRFEYLLVQFDSAAPSHADWHTRLALLTLFDLTELVSRSELRGELGKFLNRLRKRLVNLLDHGDVDNSALEQTLDELDQVNHALHTMYGGELNIVSHQSFLQMVRQRSTLPAGCCSFDVPALHHWLETTPDYERHQQLLHWVEPFTPLRDGTRLVLSLLRSSAYPRQQHAEQGRFQQTLDEHNPPQLLRLEIAREQRVFPEISGDLHRVTIRFMTQDTPDELIQVDTQTIPFRLTYCRI